MTGIFGNHPEDRQRERELDAYLDSCDEDGSLLDKADQEYEMECVRADDKRKEMKELELLDKITCKICNGVGWIVHKYDDGEHECDCQE